jgi:sulfur carrier protein ThiS
MKKLKTNRSTNRKELLVIYQQKIKEREKIVEKNGDIIANKLQRKIISNRNRKRIEVRTK